MKMGLGTGGGSDTKIFYGWFVVGGLVGIAFFGPMGRYILTSLFPFIMEDPGWSRQTIGLAFTIHFWVYALFAVLAGRLIDRIGGKRTIAAGGLLMLIGLVCLALMREIWQFYLIFGVLLAAAVSMTHFVPNTAIVRKWFVKKAGMATGMVGVGTVIGLAALPPVISRLSAAMGWRNACLICALGIGIMIILIAALIIRNTPESMGLKPYGEDAAPASPDADAVLPDRLHELSPSRSMRTRAFWYFFIVYSVTGIPLQGILSHVIIWGVEAGVAPENSGMIMAVLVLPSIPLRIMAGWLGDRFGKKRVLILFNLCAAVIWLWGWFFISGGTSFIIFCLFLGFVYSAPFSLFTPFLGDIFGRLSVGTLMGVITLGHGVIGGAGPFLWGWIADVTGSYNINCLISAGCYLAIGIFLCMIDPLTAEKVRDHSDRVSPSRSI